MIDLRSDTMTLPSDPLRHEMAWAPVGDDYYGEDPSVNRLEAYCRELFDREGALFVVSGMMANQLAIATQVPRGAEFVTEYGYHINLYESAQYAALCQVVLNGWHTADGVLRPADVEAAIASKPRGETYAAVRLVSLENTINSRQGKVFPFEVLQAMRAATRRRGLRLHLDGARIFNAHLATGIPLATYAAQADTMTACFSKGLGAPLGSILLGSREVIERARHLRVWYGGGVHQIGMCARAALWALMHQLRALEDDHRRTAWLAQEIARRTDLGVRPAEIETNMIFVDFPAASTDEPDAAERFTEACFARGLHVLVFSPRRVRLVVSRNVNDADIRHAADIIATVGDQLALSRREAQHG
jgi:threonine aldolase